jgi:thiol-disulfide isomerase/thioredoxin
MHNATLRKHINFYKLKQSKMKSYFLSLLFIVLYATTSLSQNAEHLGLKLDKTVLKQGEEINFTLNLDEIGSNSSEPVYAIFIPYVAGQYTTKEAAMTYKDKLWHVRYTVPSDATLLAVKFIQGKNIYINNEKGYIFQIYSPNGSEINDSNVSLFAVNQGGYVSGLYNGDKKKADEYYEKWEKNTDINKLDFVAKAYYFNKKNDSLQLSAHIQSLPQQANLTSNDFGRLFQLTRNLTTDAKSILDAEYSKRFPTENEHKNISTKIRNAATFDEKYKLAQAFQSSLFKESVFFDKNFDAVLGYLGSTALKNMSMAEIMKLNEIAPKGVGYEGALVYYNRVFLNTCYAKDTLVNESKPILDMTMDMAAKMQPYEKILPNFQTPQLKWQEIRVIQMICDGVKAEYYYKTKQPKLAIPLVAKAAEYYDWTAIKYNNQLIAALEAANEEDKLMDYMKNIFVAGGFDEKMVEKFKTKNKDAATLLDAYRTERIANLKKKIKAKMLNIPTADFNLTDDDNSVLKKSDLKGNVLFFDFWATWCRPCVSSFPAMQRFSDANKKNQDYKMFFVNTYQSKNDRKKEVSEFLAKNPYTFDIVYDLDDAAAKALGVSGLPTKIIMDRNSIIRFISVGTGDNENKAVEELQAMMELADEASAQSKKKTVTIKGKLIGFQNLEKIEDFSEFQLIKPTPADRTIYADSLGHFSATFELDEPNYFRLGRNVLYLSPGDDLDVVIDQSRSDAAVFKGIGAEANYYLRNTPFPKGGSFLNAGSALSKDVAETLKNINDQVTARRNELKLLTNVTDEFKRLEFARIKADLIHSIDFLEVYAFVAQKKMSKDSFEHYKKTLSYISNLFLPPMKEGFVDASLLKLTVYKDIASKLIADVPESNVEAQKIKEWLKTSKISAQLERGVTNDQLDLLKKSIDSLTNTSYKKALLDKIDTKSAFNSGSIAADFTAEDMTGQKVNLSSLKGKTIYVDLWATWCGPCMAEMPHLKTLKETFKNDKNVAIVSLSIDDSNALWLKYLKNNNSEGIQWRINRLKLDAYSIISVPRYLIIDKQFKVHSLNALPPSDPKLKQILKSLL